MNFLQQERLAKLARLEQYAQERRERDLGDAASAIVASTRDKRYQSAADVFLDENASRASIMLSEGTAISRVWQSKVELTTTHAYVAAHLQQQKALREMKTVVEASRDAAKEEGVRKISMLLQQETSRRQGLEAVVAELEQRLSEAVRREERTVADLRGKIEELDRRLRADRHLHTSGVAEVKVVANRALAERAIAQDEARDAAAKAAEAEARLLEARAESERALAGSWACRLQDVEAMEAAVRAEIADAGEGALRETVGRAARMVLACEQSVVARTDLLSRQWADTVRRGLTKCAALVRAHRPGDASAAAHVAAIAALPPDADTTMMSSPSAAVATAALAHTSDLVALLPPSPAAVGAASSNAAATQRQNDAIAWIRANIAEPICAKVRGDDREIEELRDLVGQLARSAVDQEQLLRTVAENAAESTDVLVKRVRAAEASVHRAKEFVARRDAHRQRLFQSAMSTLYDDASDRLPTSVSARMIEQQEAVGRLAVALEQLSEFDEAVTRKHTGLLVGALFCSSNAGVYYNCVDRAVQADSRTNNTAVDVAVDCTPENIVLELATQDQQQKLMRRRATSGDQRSAGALQSFDPMASPSVPNFGDEVSSDDNDDDDDARNGRHNLAPSFSGAIEEIVAAIVEAGPEAVIAAARHSAFQQHAPAAIARPTATPPAHSSPGRRVASNNGNRSNNNDGGDDDEILGKTMSGSSSSRAGMADASGRNVGGPGHAGRAVHFAHQNRSSAIHDAGHDRLAELTKEQAATIESLREQLHAATLRADDAERRISVMVQGQLQRVRRLTVTTPSLNSSQQLPQLQQQPWSISTPATPSLPASFQQPAALSPFALSSPAAADTHSLHQPQQQQQQQQPLFSQQVADDERDVWAREFETRLLQVQREKVEMKRRLERALADAATAEDRRVAAVERKLGMFAEVDASHLRAAEAEARMREREFELQSLSSQQSLRGRKGGAGGGGGGSSSSQSGIAANANVSLAAAGASTTSALGFNPGVSTTSFDIMGMSLAADSKHGGGGGGLNNVSFQQSLQSSSQQTNALSRRSSVSFATPGANSAGLVPPQQALIKAGLIPDPRGPDGGGVNDGDDDDDRAGSPPLSRSPSALFGSVAGTKPGSVNTRRGSRVGGGSRGSGGAASMNFSTAASVPFSLTSVKMKKGEELLRRLQEAAAAAQQKRRSGKKLKGVAGSSGSRSPSTPQSPGGYNISNAALSSFSNAGARVPSPGGGGSSGRATPGGRSTPGGGIETAGSSRHLPVGFQKVL